MDKEPAETVAAPRVFKKFLLFKVLLGFGMSLKQEAHFKNGYIFFELQGDHKDFLYLRQPPFF